MPKEYEGKTKTVPLNCYVFLSFLNSYSFNNFLIIIYFLYHFSKRIIFSSVWQNTANIASYKICVLLHCIFLLSFYVLINFLFLRMRILLLIRLDHEALFFKPDAWSIFKPRSQFILFFYFFFSNQHLFIDLYFSSSTLRVTQSLNKRF